MEDAINTFNIGDEHPDVEVLAKGNNWQIARQGPKWRCDVQMYRAVPSVGDITPQRAAHVIAVMQQTFAGHHPETEAIAEMEAALAALHG